MADFEVKTADEIESMNEEDQTQYEKDLGEYTKNNLDKELEDQSLEEDEVVDDDDDDEKLDGLEDKDDEPEEDLDQVRKDAARYKGSAQKIEEQSRKIQELEQKQAAKDVKEPSKEDQVVYDSEHYRDLLDKDPDAASEYYYKHFVKPRMEQENQAAAQEQQINNARNTTISSLNEFNELPEIKEVVEKDEEMGLAFGTFISKTVQMPEGGYTVDDFKKAWKWFNHDKIVADTAESTKRETAKQLNDANPEVVTLTNAKDSKTKNIDKKKMTKEQATQYAEGLSDEDLDNEIEKKLG